MSAIYALADPDTGDIRYVGMTTRDDVAKRLREHSWPSAKRRGHTPLYTWLFSLDGPPQVVILQEDPEDPPAAERGWIALLREDGADLLNANDGGGGVRFERGVQA